MANERVLPPDSGRVHAGSGTQNIAALPSEPAKASLVSRSSFPPGVGAKRARESAITGGILLAAFLVQATLELDWGFLSKWQDNFAYKVGSGLLLLSFLAVQWFLALCRWQQWHHLARDVYAWHIRLGSLGPLLLFAHSTTLGFGYILVLGLTYLGNAAVGLVSPQAFPRLKQWHTSWMASHVALSVLLVVLTVYHAWTALYFE